MGIYATKKYILSVSFPTKTKIPAIKVAAHPFKANELRGLFVTGAFPHFR